MKYIFSFLLLFIAFSIHSQPDPINRCAHDQWLDEMESIQPGYKETIVESIKNFTKQKTSNSRSITITIPVHVIIVHPTGQPIGTGSNHSLAHVQSQIDVLNQDFGRYNTDSGNTPPVFPAADTGIQFCLATVDPDGNPTDGITRYAFDGAFHPNSSTIREETRWPRDSYSNIWSAPNLPYLGLASVPSTFSLPSPNQDFIHVDAATFGGPGFATFPNYNLGRTTTHEMGHWLGLLHVWGGDGCGNDDGISDTPVQDDENFGCPTHPSPSCGNSGDMFMNYMDYVNDNCMNAFTVEQGNYMNTILSTSRASLNGSSFTACAASVPLTLTVVSQEDPSCTDTNDGFILVEAAGGVPEYSYSLDGGVPSSNNLFTDLPGGTHTIEAFDSDGNSATETVFLNTPLPLTASINIVQDNECSIDSNAIVEIQISGGNNPFSFSLNNGIPQQSNTFDNLSNGSYTFNVADDNGCTVDGSFELVDTTAINITIDSTSNLICSNDNMGLIIASAEGGNGPLSYSINGFDFQDTGTFLELDGGDYFVYVQDSVGCYDSVAVNLSEPDPFFISLESIDVSCFGLNDGNVNVMAMGGNGSPFQYSFDSITFGDTTMLDSLFAGAYDLYALDSLGCLAIASFEIDEPDSIVIAIDTLINEDCFGDENGAISLITTGGNGGYMYILEGDSTETGMFSNLGSGIYEVWVVDNKGCEGSSTFEIGVNSTIAISIENSELPSCFGESDGVIEVAAENTSGNVMYSLNGGAMQESPIFGNLSMGDYQIIVQDASGCSAVLMYTLDEPAMLGGEVDVVNNVSCNGGSDGSVSLAAITGGTPPYQYSFSPGGGDGTELSAGTYSIIITDENGCTLSDEFIITEPDILELIVEGSEGADCETAMGASINFSAQGGSGGYSFELNGPSGNIPSEDGSYNELTYGLHEVKVTDSNNCEVSMDAYVTLENDFYAEISSVTDIQCYGESGGALDLYVQGGIGTISYMLEGNLEVDPNDLNLDEGDYSLSVVDENDCEIELAFSLVAPEELVVEQFVFDNTEGTVSVIVSGGIEPYLYSFDEGVTFSDDNSTEDTGSTSINVIVKDANGCEVETTFFIDDVNDLASNWGIKLYPNPFQNDIILDMEFQNPTLATIEVFDINGRLVHKISGKKYNSGNNFVKIDLSNFASSIYIVKIASAEGYRYIKATKM